MIISGTEQWNLCLSHTHIRTYAHFLTCLDAFCFPARLGPSVQTFCGAGVNLPLSWMDQAPNSTAQRQRDSHLHFRVVKLRFFPSLVNPVSEASVVSLNLGSFVCQVLPELLIVLNNISTTLEILSVHYLR